MLYGTGMRLKETLRLRIQDLDFLKGSVTVRNGKGAKDRITVLPESIQPKLKEHLNCVQAQFRRDLVDGYVDVYLPYALARKYPKAGQEWRWQYVFPAEYPSKDPRSGKMRRHHIYDRSVGRTIDKVADLAGITKHVTAHTFLLLHICWSRGLVFAWFRNFWVIRVLKRLRFICIASIRQVSR